MPALDPREVLTRAVSSQELSMFVKRSQEMRPVRIVEDPQFGPLAKRKQSTVRNCNPRRPPNYRQPTITSRSCPLLARKATNRGNPARWVSLTFHALPFLKHFDGECLSSV